MTTKTPTATGRTTADQPTTQARPQGTHIGMSARWRLAVRRPIGQFCAHEGWLHGVPVAAPNGGYARQALLGVIPAPAGFGHGVGGAHRLGVDDCGGGLDVAPGSGPDLGAQLAVQPG